MRALHALAPVGRWELLEPADQRLAIAAGWKALEAIERADGWWELGQGATLVRYQPSGFRKPQVCMAVECWERSELDDYVPARRAVPLPERPYLGAGDDL